MQRMNRPQTGKQALQWAVFFLTEGGFAETQAQAESRSLLAKTWECDLLQVVTGLERILEPPEWQQFSQLVQERAKWEPLQYLTGKQEFMSLPFRISPGVFIPRWDTEVLVEEAIRILKNEDSPRILDLCSGSGAIALSLANYLPKSRVWAVDLSSAALNISRENARLLNVDAQTTFLLGDLFAPVPQTEKFDLIVSNPPYISAVEMVDLPADVQKEPHLALYGGADGLDYYRRLAATAGKYLRPGSYLLLEIGWQQGREVIKLLINSGFSDVRTLQDLGGKDRAVIGKAPLKTPV